MDPTERVADEPEFDEDEFMSQEDAEYDPTVDVNEDDT